MKANTTTMKAKALKAKALKAYTMTMNAKELKAFMTRKANTTTTTTTTMKANTTVSSRKDKSWMRNPDQLKNRKIFSIMAERNPDGSFLLLGGEQRVFVKKNQYVGEWVNVDTRDLGIELRNSAIHTY